MIGGHLFVVRCPLSVVSGWCRRIWWWTREAQRAAPKPLSMLRTLTLEAQLLSMAKRGARPVVEAPLVRRHPARLSVRERIRSPSRDASMASSRRSAPRNRSRCIRLMVTRALVRRGLAPIARKRGPCGRHRAVDVLRPGHRNACQRLAGGRLGQVADLTRLRLDQLAVDEEAVLPLGCDRHRG